MTREVLDRLVQEHKELKENHKKLSAFLQSQEQRNKVSQAQLGLLKRQHGLQGELVGVLAQRMKLLTIDVIQAEAEAKAATAAQQPEAKPKAEAKATKKAPAPRKRTTTKKKASTTGSEAVE